MPIEIPAATRANIWIWLLLIVVVNTVMVQASVLGQEAADSPSAKPATAGMQVAQQFQRVVGVDQQLNYLLYLPRDYRADRDEGWPLMLFLHGAGERGDDLQRVKVHGPPKLVEQDPDWPFILVSPQCPAGQTWDASVLSGLLDDIVERHNVDLNRVYLTGLSMGGYGTWRLGLANPERFAAIAPICGGGELIQLLLVEPARKEALQSLPVWAFHGAKDPLVPLAESERLIDGLKRLGATRVKLTTYPEVGHDSWTQSYENPELFEWMLQQKRP